MQAHDKEAQGNPLLAALTVYQDRLGHSSSELCAVARDLAAIPHTDAAPDPRAGLLGVLEASAFAAFDQFSELERTSAQALGSGAEMAPLRARLAQLEDDERKARMDGKGGPAVLDVKLGLCRRLVALGEERHEALATSSTALNEGLGALGSAQGRAASDLENLAASLAHQHQSLEGQHAAAARALDDHHAFLASNQAEIAALEARLSALREERTARIAAAQDQQHAELKAQAESALKLNRLARAGVRAESALIASSMDALAKEWRSRAERVEAERQAIERDRIALLTRLSSVLAVWITKREAKLHLMHSLVDNANQAEAEGLQVSFDLPRTKQEMQALEAALDDHKRQLEAVDRRLQELGHHRALGSPPEFSPLDRSQVGRVVHGGVGSPGGGGGGGGSYGGNEVGSASWMGDVNRELGSLVLGDGFDAGFSQPHSQPPQYQPHQPHSQPQHHQSHSQQPQYQPHSQQPQYEPQPQFQYQHQPQLQPHAQPHQPQYQPHSQPHSQPQPQPHSQSQPQPQFQPQPQPHSQSQPQPQFQPQPQPHSQSQPQPQPQSHLPNAEHLGVQSIPPGSTMPTYPQAQQPPPSSPPHQFTSSAVSPGSAFGGAPTPQPQPDYSSRYHEPPPAPDNSVRATMLELGYDSATAGRVSERAAVLGLSTDEAVDRFMSGTLFDNEPAANHPASDRSARGGSAVPVAVGGGSAGAGGAAGVGGGLLASHSALAHMAPSPSTAPFGSMLELQEKEIVGRRRRTLYFLLSGKELVYGEPNSPDLVNLLDVLSVDDIAVVGRTQVGPTWSVFERPAAEGFAFEIHNPRLPGEQLVVRAENAALRAEWIARLAHAISSGAVAPPVSSSFGANPQESPQDMASKLVAMGFAREHVAEAVASAAGFDEALERVMARSSSGSSVLSPSPPTPQQADPPRRHGPQQAESNHIAKCGSCGTGFSYPTGAVRVQCHACSAINTMPKPATAQLRCGFCNKLANVRRDQRSFVCQHCNVVNQVNTN